MVLRINTHWLASIWFLREVERDCQVQVAMSVMPLVFVPKEKPPPQTLYVINRGAVLFEARLLTRHMVWGEDVLLTSERFRSKGVAFSMTYLEVYSLTHDALMTVRAPERGGRGAREPRLACARASAIAPPHTPRARRLP